MIMTRPPLTPRPPAEQSALDTLDAQLRAVVAQFVAHGDPNGDLRHRETALRAELDRLRPEWTGVQ